MARKEFVRLRVRIIPFLSLFLMLVTALGCLEEGAKNDEIEGWNNLHEIQNDVKSSLPHKYRILSNTTNSINIQNPEKTVLFIIGIETPITTDERVSLIEYVKKGGTLVFASDNYELAEPFTKTFRIRYYPNELLDPGFTYNRAFITSTTHFFGDRMDVMLNAPRGLNITGGNDKNESSAGPVDLEEEPIEDDNIVRVLASSPVLVKDFQIVGYSFVDLNDNGEQDNWDLDGPIALGYRVKRGNGMAYIFGNSGLFLDDFYSRSDNREFVRKLITSSIPDDGTVYFDMTHHVSQRSHHLGYAEE